MVTAATMAGHGVTTVSTLSLSLHSGAGLRDLPRKHFGFADGVSQPLPQLNENLRDKLHGIPVGEVLMGYPNAHNEIAPMPYVTGSDRGSLADVGFDQASLGLNGSDLVVRQRGQPAPRLGIGWPAVQAKWVR